MTAQEVLDLWIQWEPLIRRRVELIGCVGLIRMDCAVRFGFEMFDRDDLWWCRHLFEWSRVFHRKWYGEKNDEETDQIVNAFDESIGRNFGDEDSKRYATLIPVWWPDPAWFSFVINRGYRWDYERHRMVKTIAG